MSNESQINELLVLEAFSNSSHLSINKKLMENIGLQEAVLFSDLLSKYKYFKNKNQLIDKKWFFNTGKNIEKDTTINEYKQKILIDKLVYLELIDFKLKGTPPKKHFKINFLKIKILISEKLRNLNLKNSEIINKNNINKNNINKTILKNSKESDSDSKDSINESLKETKSFNKDSEPTQKQNNPLILPKGSLANCAIRIIGKWNSFEQTSIHKTQQPYSKTYIKLINDLVKLQKGIFFKNKIIDEEWIKQNNIPDEIFDKAWNLSELTIAINHLSKYSLEGYWPRGNKTPYKGLPNLLYNPMSKKSLLIKSFINPSKQLKEVIEEELNNKPFETEYPRAQTQIKESPIWPKGKTFLPQDERKIENKIKKLALFVDNLIDDKKDTQSIIHYWIGDLQKLIREYLKWLHLDKQDWVTKNFNLFDPDSNIFSKFIIDLEKDVKFKVRSKGWETK